MSCTTHGRARRVPHAPCACSTLHAPCACSAPHAPCARSVRSARSPFAPILRPAVALVPLLAALAPHAAQAQIQRPGHSITDTVVVTANRTPQPLSTVLADVSVITREEIERAAVSDVADLLARLPGVEISRSGGPASQTSVYIRGGENRHTALYIDGVRIDSQSVAGAMWEQIPLEQIDRVEVLRGPAAAIYGSDAIAGVVQLFTKRGRGPAKPTVTVGGGSRGMAAAQVGVSGSADALDYSLSAAHSRGDGFDAQTKAAAGHNPDRDGWRRSSVLARAGWQLSRAQRIEASLLNTHQRAQYDDFLPGVNDVNSYRLGSASLSWLSRWSASSNTRVQLGQSETTYQSRPNFYRTETTLRNALLQHEQRLDGAAGEQWLSVTLERREDELFNPATDFSDALSGKRHQDGIGLGWRAGFGDHSLQAHLRHDDDSEFGGKSTGSLSWGWAFAPRWRLSASAATSFRAPTLYERFSQYGNAALAPEEGRNVEIGLRWKAAGGPALAGAARPAEASLTVWRGKVTNAIGFGDPGPCFDSFGCFVNVGRARMQGATLAGQTEVRTALGVVTLRGSIDWHDPRNLDNDKLLQRRARRLATLGAETRLAGWTVGADIQAASKRYEDVANTQAMGGYALLGLFASTRLMDGLTLEGRIDNVADKRYELARTYATPGRAAQVTLRWTMP
jgi:vitamin B12 transporter